MEMTGEHEERGWKYKRLVAAEVADGGGSCRCTAPFGKLQPGPGMILLWARSPESISDRVLSAQEKMNRR